MIKQLSQDDLAVTLGIEEEFFLVDPKTRDLLADPDPAIFDACESTSGPHKVVRELLRTQVETNTKVCSSIAELREAMRETRRIVIQAAERFGAGVMASSTHPFADWQVQSTTQKERYESFANKFQDILRRFLVGGMHIHLGFGDADTRTRVMTAMRRYLPSLLALSTSSPFSDGRETGFKSWRIAIVGSLPRTGIPKPIWSRSQYNQLVEEYRRFRFIGDSSELWWDIRPSNHYPTVEMRICDICTRLEDAICIAALYASLVRMLIRQDRQNALPMEPLTEIIAENRWIAQRYGVFSFFGDSAQKDRRIDIEDFISEMVEQVAPDACALGCEAETRRAITIVKEGTSADRQLDLFRLRRLEGDSNREAFQHIVDQILEETREGVDI